MVEVKLYSEKKETLPDCTRKYKGDTDTRLYEDAYRQFLEFLATTQTIPIPLMEFI